MQKISFRQVFMAAALHSTHHHIFIPIEMFRYKRLIFGINAAAEMFQDVIASAISDIPSVKNISDDVIIYGANRKEHNKTLHAM